MNQVTGKGATAMIKKNVSIFALLMYYTFPRPHFHHTPGLLGLRFFLGFLCLRGLRSPSCVEAGSVGWSRFMCSFSLSFRLNCFPHSEHRNSRWSECLLEGGRARVTSCGIQSISTSDNFIIRQLSLRPVRGKGGGGTESEP